MKKRMLLKAAVIILMAAALPAAAEEARPVRIEWESVRGAQGYIVQVKDGEGRELVKKTVDKSYAVLDLAPGSYRVRISALNVFLKPGSSSDWTEITVMKKEPKREETEGDATTQIGKLGRQEAEVSKEEREREEAIKREEARRKEEQARRKAEGYPRGLAGLGPLDIALGGGFHFPVTGWKKYLDPAPAGHVMLSYRLSGIPAAANIPVIANFGFAARFSVVPFQGKTKDGARMGLMAMPLGAGIFYDFKLGRVNKWAFDLRLAALAGACFSTLDIKGIFPKNKMITRLYYDPQLSFRFVCDGYFFMEIGCGFRSVLFSGQALSTVYPFAQIGIRL